ncbi:MAG: type I-C CRISPR-associated protein Cas8c/Csd1 [Zoogloea sp.]|nr:type I-C CRISPR-associated protein Cas8c/Csd1 [Zoogloea sp.]
MILQALYDYYQRKCAAADPAERLPAYGLEEKEIPFVLEITADGDLVQLRDTRSQEGKKKVGRRYRVPQGIKKTSGVAANLLWDACEYVTGIDTRGKPERVAEQHAAFRARINALPESAQADAGLKAVQAYLDKLDPERLAQEPAFAEAKESNALMSFQLHGEPQLVCQRPAVASAAMAAGEPGNGVPTALCLVTGQPAETERLHAAIKGVWGAQTAGANVVSFNLDAFESYGKRKRQGDNAPVGKPAAFAYTTALNHLLGKGSRNRFQVGDASTVCWAEQQGEAVSEYDTLLADIFGHHDDPDAGVKAVSTLFESVHSGRFDGAEGAARYFVLGLAPNAARISVRFFHTLTLAELAPRILQHFKDLQLKHGPNDADYPSLFRLLTACAAQGKADNIPPNLGGAIVDAILADPDAPYPSLWLNAAVNRCRAEREVNYHRAAAIKACLNRSIRRHPQEKEFQPMLDLDNTNAAYRLGRLFAVLEKIQEEASPGLNATIRDRYYGAASSTPVAVFTTLLRLKNAHLKKLPQGRSVSFEKLLGEVLSAVTDFPAHLTLADQGRFALGYYHQRQAFFTKSDKTPSTESTEEKQ